jgi:hypothetical protein
LPAAESGLHLSTADDELTVGFHTDHEHFTDYDNRLNPQAIETGLRYAADIINERRGVVSWYRGEHLAHTSTIALPHEGPLPRLLSSCTRGTLRSWSGRFDRDEQAVADHPSLQGEAAELSAIADRLSRLTPTQAEELKQYLSGRVQQASPERREK